MIFFVLSGLFAFLGALGQRAFLLGLALLVSLPLSNAFAVYLYRFGLYPYDFFFLSLAGYQVFLCLQRKTIPRIGLSALVVLLLPSLYALFALMLVPLDTYFLRDLRPILFGLQAVVLILALEQGRVHQRIAAGTLENIVALAAGTNLLWFVAVMAGLIDMSDIYYQKNTYRYADLSTYIALAYLAFAPRVSSNKVWVISLLAMLAVFVSGFRVLIALALVIWIVRTPGLTRSIVKGSLATLVLVGYVTFLATVDSSRIERSSTVAGIAYQVSSRYSPFFANTDFTDKSKLLFGHGHGFTFHIPWFGYRENVDDRNNFVDNIYLTFLAKYGAFSILYLGGLFHLIGSILVGVRQRVGLAPLGFLMVLGMFYCLPYQPAAPGLLLGLFLVRALSSRYLPERVASGPYIAKAV